MRLEKGLIGVALRSTAATATLAVLIVVIANARDPARLASAAESASPALQTVSSDIVNFTLQNLTVAVGTTVMWTNLDTAPHTSTSGQSPTSDGIWNSGILSQNQASAAIAFNTPGTFPYFCTVHPSMQATVEVQAAATPTPTPVPTATPAPAVATPTPTSGEPPSPTSTPRPTPTITPTPQVTVVPEEEITPADADGGSVIVVQPTAPGTVALPEHGLKLELPTLARLKTFQARIRTVEPGSLPIVPDARVLRSFDIDLFDEKGLPEQDTGLRSAARVSVALSDAEVLDLGGLSALLSAVLTGEIRFQKLSITGDFWSDLITSFDVQTQTFSTIVSRFSTFVLVSSSEDLGITDGPKPSPTPTSIAPITQPPAAPPTGDVTASGLTLLVLAGLGIVSVLGGVWFLFNLRQRR